MKHKNYEWIVAFAEGKEVQYYIDIYDDRMTGKPDWHTVDALPVFELESVKFRIKPEVKKTVGYRRYVYKNPYNGMHHVHITHECYVGSGCSSDPEFLDSMDVRWIDTEWQYETVEDK